MAAAVLAAMPVVARAAGQDPPPPPPPPQPVPAASRALNPDISVIANFLGVAGRNPMSTEPVLQLTEAEIAFQTAVDPYARADFFFAASPEGLEIEEGYITFTTLPARLLLKAGKMRAQFGKMNTLHTHQRPWADVPLVTTNLVGGNEGLSDSGMSLSYLVQNPFVFLDLIGEVYGGRSEVFESPERSRLVYVARVRGYRDFTDSMNLDAGGSWAFGPAPVEGASSDDEPVTTAFVDKRLAGFDVTFRYRPPERAIYRRLNLRTEWIWSRHDLPAAEAVRTFGVYAYGEYQFARRWYIGARIDRSGRVLDADARDTGQSVFLSFWPSEYSQIRGQVRRTRFAEGVTAHEFLFQFNFSIGAHGVHVF
jgi:hypothetical protein